MFDFDHVLKIARKTRIWAKRSRSRYGIIDPNLTGMCAIAAHRLFLNLRASSIPANLVITSTHAWVEVGDHSVDVTASQFNKAPVLLIPSKRYHRHIGGVNLIGKKIRFSCADKYINHMKIVGWDRSQTPR